MAASPRQIYADLADNGRLDNTYNPADLQNAALSPAVEGYGGVVVEQLQPTAAVAGAQKTLAGRPSYSCAELKSQAAKGSGTAAAQYKHLCGSVAGTQATLPFTGMQLSLFLVIGLALLSSGVLLRRTAKEKSRS